MSYGIKSHARNYRIALLKVFGWSAFALVLVVYVISR